MSIAEVSCLDVAMSMVLPIPAILPRYGVLLRPVLDPSLPTLSTLIEPTQTLPPVIRSESQVATERR
jgi:hypothetical protein